MDAPSLPGPASPARAQRSARTQEDATTTCETRVGVMNLTLTKTANPDQVQVGELLTYTLTYENQGTGVAHNVNITDELDRRVTLITADPAPFSNNTKSITWTIPHLEQDGTHAI